MAPSLAGKSLPDARARPSGPGAAPTIGVVGLGSMGMGIATSSCRGGLTTYGIDLNPDLVGAFTGQGGRTGDLPDIAPGLDILVLVVVNAAQVENILFGAPDAACLLPQGALVVGCPTMSAEDARTFETRLNALGLEYLDAPISGGSLKAADGALTVMASGSQAAFDKAAPLLDTCAETVFRLGDRAGPGSAMKMVNQLLAGVHIAAAAEAMVFGLTQGIAADKTLDVISRCAGTSWMFENRGPHIATGDYTPHSAVDIFVKDLGIVTRAAQASGLAPVLARTAESQFREAQAAGLGREDDAAVAKIYARAAGVKLPGDS